MEESIRVKSAVIGALVVDAVFFFQTVGDYPGNLFVHLSLYSVTFIQYFMVFALLFFVFIGPLNRYLDGRVKGWGRFGLSVVIAIALCVSKLSTAYPVMTTRDVIENATLFAAMMAAIVSYHKMQEQVR